MFKQFRIFVLLFVLLNVALSAWLARTRSTDWDKPLAVVVYAINGDNSEVASDWIEHLTALDVEEIETFFGGIENFFEREAARYGLALAHPVDIEFAGERRERPPQPPRGGSTLSIIAWSLQLRFWSWWHDDYPYSQDVEIFVLYFDAEQSATLGHSLGLQKGLIGVVNAFASKTMKNQNHIVIAHELLHTLGATDKYDPATNMPLFPQGFAEPERTPRYPQERAEIMAGRYAISPHAVQTPRGLKQVVIGSMTAHEINWLD